VSFGHEVKRSGLWPWSKDTIRHKTAIFRQVNVDSCHAHHDALEFPDGDISLLTYLMEGQEATVLQLPASAIGSKAIPQAAYALAIASIAQLYASREVSRRVEAVPAGFFHVMMNAMS
jgi:hypothetical protein